MTDKTDSRGGCNVIQVRLQRERGFERVWLSQEQLERVRPLLPSQFM